MKGIAYISLYIAAFLLTACAVDPLSPMLSDAPQLSDSIGGSASEPFKLYQGTIQY